MTLITFDDVLLNPKQYVADIYGCDFQDIEDGENVFKNIQVRNAYDEFYQYVTNIFSNYEVKLNFIRKSPLNQKEPNFIHSDEMMGDVTCILYLNENAPADDGTTFYDVDSKPLATVYSKFNRMVAFDADVLHSRNIFENFGDGESSRLIQVIFLRYKQ